MLENIEKKTPHPNIQGDPEKIWISVFFNVFCKFFWVTVSYTEKIENCLYLEDFLESIEHNRKIRNSKNYIEKKLRNKKCATATFICSFVHFEERKNFC